MADWLTDIRASFEEMGEVERSVRMEVPRSIVDNLCAQAVEVQARKAHLKGFRKGKAPKSLIAKVYNADIKNRTVSDVLERGIRHFVQQHELKLAESPVLESLSMEDGQPVTATFRVYLYPVPQITHHDDLEVDVELGVYDDSLVDTFVNGLAEQHGTVVEVSGRATVEDGDFLTLRYQVYQDGELAVDRWDDPIKWLRFTKSNVVPICYTALLGKSIGDEVECSEDLAPESADKSVSEGSADGDLAGEAVRGEGDSQQVKQVVRYRIQPLVIGRLEPHPINDDLARLAGEEDGLDTLRVKYAEATKAKIDEDNKSRIKKAVLDKLSECNKFSFPEVMIKREVRYMLDVSLGGKELTEERFNSAYPYYRPMAEEIVRNKVILDRIVEQESLSLSDSDWKAAVESKAVAYGVEPDVFAEFVKSNRSYGGLFRETFLRDKATELLIDRAKINKKFVVGRSDD